MWYNLFVFRDKTFLFLLLVLLLVYARNAHTTNPPDAYNVVWHSPSEDHHGSMPIGNGDIGMNVWVEQTGDLILLLSKSDAWSENHRLLKLGRVRVKLSPNPFAEGASFTQTLRLSQGEIEITGGEAGKATTIRIWVDANNPVIRVEVDGTSPLDMEAGLEIWRTSRRELTGDELHSAYGVHGGPDPVYVYPDKILTGQEHRIVWYHRNEHSIWEENFKHQKLSGFIEHLSDPLMNRTFGATIEGSGLVSVDSSTLRSESLQKRFVLSIHPLCAQTETPQQWQDSLKERVDRNNSSELEKTLRRHQSWWEEFWNRSWIRITGFPEAKTLTQAYILQRWINACAGRGAFPIKFNGSLFTVPESGYDADYRRWGGPYWWQNTRLTYWPMLASGDFDMMKPLFRMYKNMLPLEDYRTRVWHNHGGSFIGETVYFWGMYTNANYGWNRSDDMAIGELKNQYIRREYTASVELMAMMLDYYAYTGDETFLQQTLLPICDSLLEFWDKHYETDENGKLKMYPTQALETYWDVVNPTPDVSGLKWVLKKLLDIPKDKIGAPRQNNWENLAGRIPSLPMAEENGEKYIAPAGKIYGERHNSENPELYAVFPFRIYGVGNPDLDIARFTFQRRPVKDNSGWRQDDIQAAMLGLTETAADYVVGRAKNNHKESRFPAFWGPNFDWIPDQDHGNVLMKALQSMLMQTAKGKILLMPAWPENWNAEFRLHAPEQTTVEGIIENGELTEAKVSPESRRKDLSVIADDPSLFQTTDQKPDFMLFPNPTKDYVSLNAPIQAKVSKISIYSIDGKLLKIKEGLYNKDRIKVSDLSSGQYIVKIQTDKQQYVRILGISN